MFVMRSPVFFCGASDEYLRAKLIARAAAFRFLFSIGYAMERNFYAVLGLQAH
jgi:hypothetical protein